MIEKIRPLTGCVSPRGEGQGIIWKGIKKRKRHNA